MKYDKKLNFVLSIVSMYPHKFGQLLHQATKPHYAGASQVEVQTFLKHSLDTFFMELVQIEAIPDIPYTGEGWYWKMNSLNIKPNPIVEIEMSITITASRAKSIDNDSATFRMALDKEYGLVIEVLGQTEGFGYGN